MAKYSNTVPQGLAGTGNATIYGVNPVAGQFAQQLAMLRERERRDALLQQREAERLAKSFKDNELAASEGRLWADQVGKLEQDHIMRGGALKQRGIDPYGSSPEALDYQKERRRVESLRGYRKALEEQYNNLIKQIQTKGVENFEPEDIVKLNEFVSKGNLQKSYSGNFQLPVIRERFSPNTLLKDIKAITQNDVDVNGNLKSDRKFIDRKATEEAIIGRLNSDPRGQQFLNKITGGIPVQTLLNIPKTIEANRNEIIKEYQGNPQLRQSLATNEGIIGEGKDFNEWVDVTAQRRANARNNFDNQMENFVANASQGVALWDKETPDLTMANYDLNRQRVGIAQQNANRLAAGASDDITEDDFEVERLELYSALQYDKNGDPIPNSSKSKIVFDKAVKVRSVALPSTQIKEAYSVKQGKTISITDPEDLEGLKLASIGWTPSRSGGYKRKAILVNSKDNFIVDESEVSIDIRKGKAYQAALRALGSAPSSSKPKTVTKTTTLKGIPKGGF